VSSAAGAAAICEVVTQVHVDVPVLECMLLVNRAALAELVLLLLLLLLLPLLLLLIMAVLLVHGCMFVWLLQSSCACCCCCCCSVELGTLTAEFTKSGVCASLLVVVEMMTQQLRSSVFCLISLTSAICRW
jgi:hypothetical protein